MLNEMTLAISRTRTAFAGAGDCGVFGGAAGGDEHFGGGGDERAGEPDAGFAAGYAGYVAATYIWGKLRGLVSFMLPFLAVPTRSRCVLMVLYDLGAVDAFCESGAAPMDWAVQTDALRGRLPRRWRWR